MSLSVENLSFAYGAVPVLRDVSFTAEGGELVSVLGPNGVGKTTLFRCILGTLTPQMGHIKMDGQDLATLPPRERARRIAYIPQIHPPTFGYTVLDTVLMGAALSALVTLPLALPFQATPHDLGLLAMLGSVQLAIPCVLSVWCARVLKAPEVSLLQLLEVLFGITLAWLGANEAPGTAVMLGGSLVLGALVSNEALGWWQRRAVL